MEEAGCVAASPRQGLGGACYFAGIRVKWGGRKGGALRQIEEQDYEAALRQEGYQDIMKYGVAFYRKECMIKKVS